MAKRKIYRFKGTEGASIPGAKVKKWIQQHHDHHEVRAHFVGKRILEKILKQPGCVGIRMHHAIDDNHQKTMILVGADAKGNNMWPEGTTGKAKAKGTPKFLAADQMFPCPPYCPPPPPPQE